MTSMMQWFSSNFYLYYRPTLPLALFVRYVSHSNSVSILKLIPSYQKGYHNQNLTFLEQGAKPVSDGTTWQGH